jgi:hypothetical protein
VKPHKVKAETSKNLHQVMSDPPQENHLQKLKGAATPASRNKPGEFNFEGSAIFWDGASNKAKLGGCVDNEGSVCVKSVEGKPPLFKARGVGRRCVFESCGNSVRGSASLCTLHKGGKRCEANGCGKSAQGNTTFCKSHEGAATTAIGVNVPNNWTNSCPIVNALIDAQCTQLEADNKAHNSQMLAEQRASLQHNPQLLTAHHAEYAEAYMQQQQYYNMQEASSSADAPGGRNGRALSLQTPNLRSWLLSPLNGEYSPLNGRVLL